MDHLTLALTTMPINLSSLNKSILVLSETEEPQNAWPRQDVPLAVSPHSGNHLLPRATMHSVHKHGLTHFSSLAAECRLIFGYRWNKELLTQ